MSVSESPSLMLSGEFHKVVRTTSTAKKVTASTCCKTEPPKNMQ